VDSPEVWYVGYGSNLDENRLDKYLLDGKTTEHNTSRETRWVELKRHQIYFAGKSKTWEGAVAFCALKSEQPRPFPVKAHRLQLKELSVVAAKENGYSSIAWDPASAFDLEINKWLSLPVVLAKDGFAGKYNAILRLPDIDSIRVYAFDFTCAANRSASFSLYQVDHCSPYQPYRCSKSSFAASKGSIDWPDGQSCLRGL
jgi:hypothetical protein